MRTRLIVGLAATTAAAGLVLTAAPASAAKPAPSVANTSQTVAFRHSGDGGSTAINFGSSSFTVPAYKDKGTFTNTGHKLTMTITQSRTGDKGCAFKGTYKRKAKAYAGTYRCPGGVKGVFTVSAIAPTT